MARVHDWSLLEADLRRRLGNAVRFDEAHRATYSADASLYRQVPIGVVVPRSMEDFIAGVKFCRQHEAPILIRGGGTSMRSEEHTSELQSLMAHIVCRLLLEK